MGDFRDPASAAGKALDDLGLSGQNFDQIITTLAGNSEQAARVLQTLGDRPRAALQALLADGGGALRELNAIIDNSEGSANAPLMRCGARSTSRWTASPQPLIAPRSRWQRRSRSRWRMGCSSWRTN